MEPFAAIPEQAEAKRLLTAALGDGEAHAFLFHGPAGVGKTAAAFAFAGAQLGDARRVVERTHPDLRVVEPLGDMIRIDVIRDLHHDLHLRPFEADRRVYLLLSAHLLNDDAADALAEGPRGAAPLRDDRARRRPARADPGDDPLALPARSVPATLRARGARLARRAGARARGEEATAIARVAGGRLDRARRLIDPEVRERRAAIIAAARGRVSRPELRAGRRLPGPARCDRAAGRRRRTGRRSVVDGLDLTPREAEQRVKRVQRGAEREEMLAQLDELAAWYRDLVVVASGAESAVIHADHLDELRADVARDLGRGAERAAALVRQSWRSAEEFNVNTGLWLDALFVQLRRAFA